MSGNKDIYYKLSINTTLVGVNILTLCFQQPKSGLHAHTQISIDSSPSKMKRERDVWAT